MTTIYFTSLVDPLKEKLLQHPSCFFLNVESVEFLCVLKLHKPKKENND